MIKKEQNIFSFSYGFIPSFFFYLCLLIDLSIPLIFFLASEDFSFFSIFLLGDYAGPILGFSSFFGILVFTFYGFVIYLGFPTESRKSAFQLVLRLIPFGFLYLMEDDILASLFKYWLLDIISICAILALYVLGHYLFTKDKKQAQKAISYKGGTLWVALLFGLPLLSISVLLFVIGYMVHNEHFSLLSVAIWLGLLAPIFFAQFRTMQNYTTKFYSKY